MNRVSFRSGLLSAAAVVAVHGAIPASAQSNSQASPPSQVAGSGGSAQASPDIIVTATRRSESVQKVPMSISVVTAAALERKAATNFFDYATSIPNLSFGNTAEGTTGTRSIAIRGIADQDTTGFYIDDTPVPESIDPQIVDVSRIEVLRGPQGSLYGARSMGGTVRLITDQPDPSGFNARIHGSIADTDHADRPDYSIDGAVNIPVVKDLIGLRIVGVHQYDAGYFQRDFPDDTGGTTTVKNVARSQTNGVSVAARANVIDNFTITPRFLYQRTSTNGFPFADVAVAEGTTPDILKPENLNQDRSFDVPELSRDEWWLATLDMHYKLPFGVITSSSSFFHRKTKDVEDQTAFIAAAFDVPPIPTSIELDGKYRSFTEEVRFSSDFKGPLQIVTGLYFTQVHSNEIFPPNVVPGLDAATGGAIGTDLTYSYTAPTVQTEYAAYGEATYNLTDHLKVIGGARVSSVKSTTHVEADGYANGGPLTIPRNSLTETSVQPKASVQYSFSRASQVYFTAAKGFRPGGTGGDVPAAFGCSEDLAAIGRTVASTDSYRSDSVWSYEVGVKSNAVHGAVTVDAAAFRIDWSHIQQTVQLSCGFNFRANAGAARSQGGEIEITARPLKGLELGFGMGYTDAKFTQDAPGTLFLKGDRVPQVPHYTVDSSIDYSFPVSDRIKGFLHADYRYVGDSTSATNPVTDPDNGHLVPRIRPSYDIIDLRGGVDIGQHELAVFVKNLTNQLASLGDARSIAAEAPGLARVSINQPRTIGVEFRSRF